MLLQPWVWFTPSSSRTRRVASRVRQAGLDVGAQRQGQAVDDDVFARDAEGFGPLDDLVGDLHAGRRFGRDALLVEGEADDRHVRTP